MRQDLENDDGEECDAILALLKKAQERKKGQLRDSEPAYQLMQQMDSIDERKDAELAKLYEEYKKSKEDL